MLLLLPLLLRATIMPTPCGAAARDARILPILNQGLGPKSRLGRWHRGEERQRHHYQQQQQGQARQCGKERACPPP
jgi:hypothetical protein